MNTPLEGPLAAAGLSDLVDAARDGRPFPRDALERVLAARNPLAAAALADIRRQAGPDRDVTHPWTLRVRAPGVAVPMESGLFVSHDASDLEGIEATEIEIVGIPEGPISLAQATEIVGAVAGARGDLPIRAFTAAQILRIAQDAGMDAGSVLARLSLSGLSTLSWAPGSDDEPATLGIQGAAHAAGLAGAVPVPYAKGRVDGSLLNRIQSVRALAEQGGRVLSAVPLPDRTEGASPLEGTAGTEDTIVFALVRLGLGVREVPHVTADAHVLGHKLAAFLLSAGADDFVGAQTASAWARPTNDGPRPMNPDRVRAYLIEARRSPVLRDGLFRRAPGAS